MITINPTAEAPTIDQRTAQLIRQFNQITGALSAALANGMPAQVQAVNAQGVVVRPAHPAVSAQEFSDALDRVVGSANHQAIVTALAALA